MADLQFLVNDWPVISRRLEEALSLDAGEREPWLESLVEPDSIKTKLRRLLEDAAGIETGDFLCALPKLDFEGDTPHDFADGAVAGATIGPYQLVSLLGQGGMGTVWLARRADGLLDRRVAVKLPHVSWGVSSFAARMARERNILGSLAHPNIARLYDAGIADDGRPFLALEYVDGQPIDAYAAAAGLTVRARVELVVQVARAVAHAHAHLIVHRDLKPSNILVDTHGQAHLLDFGIAKLVDPEFGESADEGAQLTRAMGRVLTPDYASPEQIRGDRIGTGSDIYSLGVVMFELLVGARPYRLQPALGPAALAEAIARLDPPRASDVARESALRSQLAGDLDSILTKALAKAPSERYATIDALADDLERHLRGEPVRARTASRWYLAERWVRRHKAESAVALALLVAVLGGAYAQVLVLTALGAGAVLALWQRNRALLQAKRALAAQARAEQVKNFIASIFTQAAPRVGQGGAVTAVDLLHAAARRVESDLSGQPEVATELGALIGTGFNELGDFRAALEWLPKVVERCTRSLGAAHPLTLASRCQLAYTANSMGALSVSEPLFPALLRDVRSVQPLPTELLVMALRSQAFVYTKRGRESEAMAALNEAVGLATAHFAPASQVVLELRGVLSNTLVHFGRPAEALRAIEPAVADSRSALGALRPHPVLIHIERFHADALARCNRPREAATILRQVLVDQRALDVEDTTRVRIVMSILSNALLLGGQLEEAQALVMQSEAMHERLTGGVNDEGIAQASRHTLVCALRGDGEEALRQLARLDALAGASGEAEALAVDRYPLRVLVLATAGQHAAALAHAEAMQDHLVALPTTGRVRVQRACALALRSAGSLARACDVSDQAVASADDGACVSLEHGLALAESACCRLATGDSERAVNRWRTALATWQRGQVDSAEVLPLFPELLPLLVAA